MAEGSSQDIGKHRVALDLVDRISNADKTGKTKDGAYWLKSYEAALTVVNGGSAEIAAQKLPPK